MMFCRLFASWHIQHSFIQSFASLFLNAVFFWPIDANGASFLYLFPESEYAEYNQDVKETVEAFREEWRESLARGKLSENFVEDRYRLLAGCTRNCTRPTEASVPW